MKDDFISIILDTAFRVLVPFTLIYGVYVLVFGEYGPGGVPGGYCPVGWSNFIQTYSRE